MHCSHAKGHHRQLCICATTPSSCHMPQARPPARAAHNPLPEPSPTLLPPADCSPTPWLSHAAATGCNSVHIREVCVSLQWLVAVHLSTSRSPNPCSLLPCACTRPMIACRLLAVLLTVHHHRHQPRSDAGCSCPRGTPPAMTGGCASASAISPTANPCSLLPDACSSIACSC